MSLNNVKFLFAVLACVCFAADMAGWQSPRIQSLGLLFLTIALMI